MFHQYNQVVENQNKKIQLVENFLKNLKIVHPVIILNKAKVCFQSVEQEESFLASLDNIEAKLADLILVLKDKESLTDDSRLEAFFKVLEEGINVDVHQYWACFGDENISYFVSSYNEKTQSLAFLDCFCFRAMQVLNQAEKAIDDSCLLGYCKAAPSAIF